MNYDCIRTTLSLLKEIPTHADNVCATLQNLLKKIKNDDLKTQKGLSFLDIKNFALLNYVANLSYVILQKISGKSIENDSAIERLVELRIILEKINPIDERLKYQINKLLLSTASGTLDSSDPLQFKANPENLINDESDEVKTKSANVYIPPKISASYFEDDPSIEGRKKKAAENSKKRALSSSVLYELQKEYDTGPEEIKEAIDPYKLKLNKAIKEREMYEEEYMMRLPMTKRQKHETMKLTTVTNFTETFNDFSHPEMKFQSSSNRNNNSKKRSKFVKRKQKKLRNKR